MELRATLPSRVTSVEWVGQDADSFRGDFAGRISSLFEQVAGKLDSRREPGRSDGGGR